MFGDKEGKRRRLKQLVALVQQAAGGLTQADLAHRLGVTRGTVNKDLVVLERRGVRPAEDARGRICWPE